MTALYNSRPCLPRETSRHVSRKRKAASSRRTPKLRLNLHPKIFDNRIRQNFARHAFGFRARIVVAQSAVQRDLEILSLPNVVDAAITKQLNGVLDRFALGIQNAWFQCDVDFRFHARVRPGNHSDRVRNSTMPEGANLTPPAKERKIIR